MKSKTILASVFLVGSFLNVLYLNKPAQADCTRWHPHHCSTGDIIREIDNCINGGGCSLPADEAWGEAGRIAYTSAQEAIAANNFRLPAESLDSFQKGRLRPHYGDLVDRVRIKYGATTLDNWRIGVYRISVPSDGQTFCNNIYITRRYRPNDFDLLELIAHEMMHSLQCQRLGGASDFGYHYFKEYKKANQNYRNNKLEREAYDFVASIDLRSEPASPLALDAHGGSGEIYFRTAEGGHNQNLHWKLDPYEDYYLLIPRVRPSVALDANGGTGTPYFRTAEGGHNQNLHWKLDPYEDYFLLLPRVGGS